MNQNKRPKDTKTLVRDIFAEHPDWNARQIYDRYLILIGDPNKAVTLNAIQKHVEDLKEIAHTKEFQDLESPWHIGLMEQYKIPPDAIPNILIVQNYLDKHPEYALTVRQVIWISRLSSLASLAGGYARKDTFKMADKLWRWARTYAEYEIIWQLSGKTLPADTTELDRSLRKDDVPRVVTLKQDGSKRILTISKDRHVSMIPPWNEKDGEK